VLQAIEIISWNPAREMDAIQAKLWIEWMATPVETDRWPMLGKPPSDDWQIPL